MLNGVEPKTPFPNSKYNAINKGKEIFNKYPIVTAHNVGRNLFLSGKCAYKLSNCTQYLFGLCYII